MTNRSQKCDRKISICRDENVSFLAEQEVRPNPESSLSIKIGMHVRDNIPGTFEMVIRPTHDGLVYASKSENKTVESRL